MLMRPNELKALLEQLNIQVFYNHTTTKDVVHFPYIVFYDDGDSSFYADNITYAESTPYRILLHTNERDFELEARLKALLTEHEIPYTLEDVDWDRTYLMWVVAFDV